MPGMKPIVHTVTMATGASVSASMDFNNSYRRVFLEVPTMSASVNNTATPIYIQGSSDNVTFRRLATVANTSTVETDDFAIASNVSNRMIPLPGFGMRYARVEISGVTATNATVFKFICSDG